MFLAAKGIPRLGEFHPYQCGNIPGKCLRNLLPVFGMDLQDPSDPFIFAFRGVIDLHPAFKGTRKNSRKRLLSDKRIVDQFEGQC